MLFNQLSEDGDEFNSKEAQLLVNILGVLSQQLDPSSDQVTAHLMWTCYTWYYLKLALIICLFLQYNEITVIIGNICKKTSLGE